MTLIQDKLPSSENFFRFHNNYEKLAAENEDSENVAMSGPKQPPR